MQIQLLQHGTARARPAARPDPPQNAVDLLELVALPDLQLEILERGRGPAQVGWARGAAEGLWQARAAAGYAGALWGS